MLLAAAVATAVTLPALHRRPGIVVWTAAAATVVWAAQLYAAGVEPLFTPLYLFLGVVTVALRPLYRRPMARRGPRLLSALGFATAIITGGALFVASPPAPPELSGPYPVGVAEMGIAAANRSTAGVLSVPTHYPADLPGAYAKPPSRARLYRDVSPVAEALGLPTFMLSRVRGAKSPGFRGARLSVREEDYPVVVVSVPGTWGADSLFFLVCEIASHGRVVLTVSDPAHVPPLAEAISKGVTDRGFAGRVRRQAVSAILVGATEEAVAAVAGSEDVGAGVVLGSEVDHETLPPRWLAVLADVEDVSTRGVIDLDLLIRFPGLFGLDENRRTRAETLPAIISHLKSQLDPG